MTDLTCDFDADHAPFVNNAHLGRTGWNPDAVAPPMKGGVYERDKPVGWPHAKEIIAWVVVIAMGSYGLIQLALMNASHLS